jgi:hypothetical protein
MKRIFDKPRGQVMVLYAGAVAFALVGAIALGTDVAAMYLDWQHAQKVADAAALAGANYLPGAITSGITYTGTVTSGCSGESTSDPASEAACTYAVNNGLPASTITISDTATTVKVVATQSNLPYFFAKALGMSTYAVSASAMADAPGPAGTDGQGMFPVGLQCNSPCDLSKLDPGQSVTFGSKFVGGLSPGNWDWLAVGGSGASNLGGVIDNGATGSYSIGTSGSCPAGSTCTISSEPGNKGSAGPVKHGLDDRLKRCATLSPDPCSGGNPSNIPAGDPCLVVVPAVDFTSTSGRTNMPIEGFAQIYLEQSSTTAQINGCFISSVAGNTITSSGAPGLGAIAAPVLIQ